MNICFVTVVCGISCFFPSESCRFFVYYCHKRVEICSDFVFVSLMNCGGFFFFFLGTFFLQVSKLLEMVE